MKSHSLYVLYVIYMYASIAVRRVGTHTYHNGCSRDLHGLCSYPVRFCFFITITITVDF